MKSTVFATTHLGLPVIAYHFGNAGKKILILGGVHGDEQEGVIGAYALVQYFLNRYEYNLQITLVPEFNLEGIILHQRMNSRGVDLNRNLPTKDWSPEIKSPRYHPGTHANSEKENQALAIYIEAEKPDFILSLHSWHPVLNVNGNCRPFAEVIHQLTGYKIDDDIGYPTPGCLGTYAGLERQSPVLTYEIERGIEPQKIIDIHVPAILQALKVYEV